MDVGQLERKRFTRVRIQGGPERPDSSRAINGVAKNLPPRERRERESNKATRGKQILTATFKAVSLLRQKIAGKRSSHSVCNHNNNPPPQRRHESYLCIELYKSLQESDLHK